MYVTVARPSSGFRPRVLRPPPSDPGAPVLNLSGALQESMRASGAAGGAAVPTGVPLGGGGDFQAALSRVSPSVSVQDSKVYAKLRRGLRSERGHLNPLVSPRSTPGMLCLVSS